MDTLSADETVHLIAGLNRGFVPWRDACRRLLCAADPTVNEILFAWARSTAQLHYGHGIYLRGLIEISSFCRNDCLYCGIRRSNTAATRYRLTADEVLEACRAGHRSGLRTFVLQGGEDRVQNDNWMTGLVARIRTEFPDTAITLSVGERSDEAYRRFREAGADRYLLRHETRNDAHYARLHPAGMSAANRRRCLYKLKDLGFQTGAGMMVGTPGQTVEHLLDDLEFLRELQPHMVGIGPFIPTPDTPFANETAGSVDQTLRLVALTRLLLPQALIPATTALATLDVNGRERAIRAGANVLMPNLTPAYVRGQYGIYAGKACSGDEAAEAIGQLKQRLKNMGYHADMGRGDSPQN